MSEHETSRLKARIATVILFFALAAVIWALIYGGPAKPVGENDID